MTNFFNKLHKTGNFLSKIFLFIATTFFIVYLFPKSGSFRYDFQRGKPWLSENLYSPLDFAIKKSKEQIESEIEKVKKEAEVYFEIDSTVVNRNKTQVMTDDYFTSLNFYSIFSEIESEKLDDGSIIVDAKIDWQTFNSKFGKIIPDGDYETIAGFIIHEIGRIPNQGEHIFSEIGQIIIVKASARKIDKIQLYPKTN